MNIETGQRTFFIAVSGVATPTNRIHDITFEDTAGNNLKCNFFEIQSASQPAASLGVYAAEVSGIPKTGNMVLNALSAVATTPNTSGICGIGGVIGNGGGVPVRWHGANGEIATGLRLQVQCNGAYALGITYGNMMPYNIVKAMNTPMYGTLNPVDGVSQGAPAGGTNTNTLGAYDRGV